jgi:hypothetical protein
MPITSATSGQANLEVRIERSSKGPIETNDLEWFNVIVKNPHPYKVVDVTLYVEMTKADGSKATTNYLIPSNTSVNYIQPGKDWCSSVQLKVGGKEEGKYSLNAVVYYDVERIESNASQGRLELEIQSAD